MSDQSSTVVYEASVYQRTVKYHNFNGREVTVDLFFALDPMQLLQLIAGFAPKTVKKSGNPAKRGTDAEISDEEQVKFVRDLASKAAGFPSEDGESWEPYENFANDLAGKAFLTKLVSSDNDRKEFSEKVLLNPLRSFVAFAKADPSNSPKEVEQFETMLGQMERIFTVDVNKDETLEDRKTRLLAELAAVDGSSE